MDRVSISYTGKVMATPMTISNLTKKMHHSFYGMDNDYILSSVGVARTGVEISIVSQDGEEVPTNSIGEIITRSPCVMSGYLNNESATKNTLKNGWLYTGDMGSIDKYGVLTLKDRSKDLIISGGMNIYPDRNRGPSYKVSNSQGGRCSWFLRMKSGEKMLLLL